MGTLVHGSRAGLTATFKHSSPAAGPIAEAIYMHKRHRHINDHREDDPFGEDYDFYDYLTAAVLDGGDGDLEMARGLLSSPGVVEVIRQDLQRDWSGIEALAGRLVAEGTVSGRDAFATIADCLRTVDGHDRSG
jgi:hypothetical protein